MQHLDG
jgi:hypothetical protein